MNKWAVVAIPLMICLVLMEAVVRQFMADRVFCRAKVRIEEYERDYQLYSRGKRDCPAPITSVGPLLKKAVKLEPHSDEYRHYLGRYYQNEATEPHLSDTSRLRLARKATEEHEKSVKLDPLNGEYHAWLAYMQGVLGEHEKAVANFDKAIELNSSNKWIQQMYDFYRRSVPTPEEDEEDPEPSVSPGP